MTDIYTVLPAPITRRAQKRELYVYTEVYTRKCAVQACELQLDIKSTNKELQM